MYISPGYTDIQWDIVLWWFPGFTAPGFQQKFTSQVSRVFCSSFPSLMFAIISPIVGPDVCGNIDKRNNRIRNKNTFDTFEIKSCHLQRTAISRPNTVMASENGVPGSGPAFGS